MSELPVIHALWIGDKLGGMSRCCLKSFVMRGHEVLLYSYNNILDIPDGVKQVDANQVISHDKIFTHKKTGSYALFSDIFRYELLKKVDGIYVDCDVYCLKPIQMPSHNYLLGYEDDTKINGAILALPKESEILTSLLDIAYDPYFVPFWYSQSKQRKLKMKKIVGIGRHISDMPWGVIGPEAITYFAEQLNVIDKVQPIDVFYPVYYQCISQLLDSNLVIDDVITSRTVCVHLYNEMLRKVDLDNISSNSILAKMLKNEI